MPDRRDPVDDAIVAAGGWLIGAVIAFFIGAFLGKQAAQRRHPNIILPGTLEVDPNKSYTIHRKARGMTAFGLLSRAGMAAFFTVACAFFTLSAMGSNQMYFAIPSLLCVFFFGYFATFWLHR